MRSHFISGRSKFSEGINALHEDIRALQATRSDGVRTARRTGGVSRVVENSTIATTSKLPIQLGVQEVARVQTRNPDGSVTTSSQRIVVCRQFQLDGDGTPVLGGSYYSVTPPYSFQHQGQITIPEIGDVTNTDALRSAVSVTRHTDHLRTVHIKGDPVSFSANNIFRPDRDQREMWWPVYEPLDVILAMPIRNPSVPAATAGSNDPDLVTATHYHGSPMTLGYVDLNVDGRHWVPRYLIAGDAIAYRPAVFEDEVLVQEEIEAGLFDVTPPTDFES